MGQSPALSAVCPVPAWTGMGRPPPRIFSCDRCGTLVTLCSHCDRGQRYCPGKCSSASRRERVSKAARRYQKSPLGRRNHRRRQARYRARLRARPSSGVTHRGSSSIPPPVFLPRRSVEVDLVLASLLARLLVAKQVPGSRSREKPRCSRCGRYVSAHRRYTFKSGEDPG